MNKSIEIVSNDVELGKYGKDYSGTISDYGVEFIRPVGRNAKSQIVWECKCGYCNQIFYSLPAVVLNGHKKSCGCLKQKNSNLRNINVQYSFYDWCVDNHHAEWIDLWDHDLNEKAPQNVGYKTSNSYWFKCPYNPTHKSEKHKISNIVKYNHLICNQCNSFAQWGINNFGNDFLKNFWDYDKNDCDPFKIARASNVKVWIKCQERDYHGSYYVSCSKFSVDGCRCPYCNKNSGNVHIYDSLGYLYPKVVELWSDKNLKSPYDYTPQTNQQVWLKCENNKHEDHLQRICNAVNREFRCPDCVKENRDSFLQTKVSNYISEKYNYTLLHEQDCTIYPVNPKTNYPMPFDNEIKELKLIIEVNGVQHYEPSFFIRLTAKKYGISTQEAFHQRQYKDEYKKQYALDNGYHFLEIPYTAENNDEYKDLIDSKINEILKQN